MHDSLRTRYFKHLAYRLRYFLLAIAAIYGFIMLPDGLVNYEAMRKKLEKGAGIPLKQLSRGDRVGGFGIHDKFGRQVVFPNEHIKTPSSSVISLRSSQYGLLLIENILGEDPNDLRQRMTSPKVKGEDVKIIVRSQSPNDVTNGNLGGCKDWNCAIRNRDSLSEQVAEAFLLDTSDKPGKRNPSQYYVLFTQESAANYAAFDLKYNLTLNFIRDSPVSSPYGYTVKLAESSRPRGPPISDHVIRNKTKPIAWFVSNCRTASFRENYVKFLERYVQVDRYGSCNGESCPFDGSCEQLLDVDYYFYLAFENSNCRDYITEKLWKHGYQHNVVPIVLKRSIVEQYVPPYSFIAADDFRTVRHLADYLKYLMQNISAYREYFEWRREYKVIFLDGNNHDELERPWGFCQLCRLLWMDPHPTYTIENFSDFWKRSCEKRGELVNKILRNERELWKTLNGTAIYDSGTGNDVDH